MPTSRARNAAASLTRPPPSCRVCRARKLKCDRQRPCSNCQSRRLGCVYDGEVKTIPTPAPVAISKSESEAVMNDEGLLAQNRVLQARLEKLENAVFGAATPSSLIQHVDTRSPSAISPIAKGSEGRALWLEAGWQQGVDVRLASPLAHLTNGLKVAILPDNQYAVNDDTNSRQIWVPAQETAMAFLDSYQFQMDAIQGIVHIPMLREKVNTFYNALHVHQPVDVGLVALLLAICASVGYWDRGSGPSLTSSTMISKASTFISKQALYAAEYTRLSAQISIEAVQAAILLAFHSCHLEGFTSRTRLLHCSAFTMARDLGLHKMDVATTTTLPVSQSRKIEMEVGRRVWWHLAASDWLLAYTGGHTDGAYSIHPHQMAVNKPRNSNWEDLSLHSPEFSQSDSVPTVMSFHLQRIRLASVCREVLDAFTGFYFSLDAGHAPYELVPTLDNKFSALIDSLPPFFSHNPNTCVSREASEDEDLHVASNRALLHLMIHTRRCKLHLPFLARFKLEPQYAFSRDTCLQSAYTVLQVGHAYWLENSKGAFPAYFQLASSLQHIFFATVVLVMDLCINEHCDPNQIRQVHRAIELIGEARGSSLMGAVFHESLMTVLQKHQMELPTAHSKRNAFHGETKSSGSVYPLSDESEFLSNIPGSQLNGDKDMGNDEQMTSTDPAFDDVLQNFLDAGASMDVQSWDALLNDLEMRTT